MKPNQGSENATTAGHVHGVNASSGGLFKATLGAAVAAAAILTFIWLPAEHGVDPTGVGHILGLTEMGHIKEQLHRESDADNAATSAVDSSTSANALPTGNSDQAGSTPTDIVQRLDAIQAQLTAIAATIQTEPAPEPEPEPEPANTDIPSSTASIVSSVSTPEISWTDEVSYNLAPTEGIEVKLTMIEGAVAEFHWTANGAVVNHDTHGDGNGQSINYEKGRAVPEQSGTLTAAFTGNHGWFWRNRTDGDVVLTLRTRGDYGTLVLP